MQNGSTKGLFQKVDGGVWYVRRVIPADVRGRILSADGKSLANFLESTRSTDGRVARMEAERLHRQWDGEIAEARRLGTGPVAGLPAVLAAIDNWRRARCDAAADFAAALDTERGEREMAEVRELVAEARDGRPSPVVWIKPPGPRSPVQEDALGWARAYFASRGAGLDQGVSIPFATAIALGRLQEAARDPSAWVRVSDFDGAFDAAVAAGGLVGVIPARLRDPARQPFARAWREVVQAEEHERHRAAVILATVAAAASTPSTIVVEGRPDAYVVREGDMTVGEVVGAFKKAREAEKPLIDKTHGHVFKALAETLGEARPWRAVTREDVRELTRFLRTVPTNASKIYPGVPLAVAAERAEADGKPTLAPNTVRAYLIALHGVCEFALEEKWGDTNPCHKQVPAKDDKVRRVGFKPDELRRIFGPLQAEREADSARWWVPAILAWTGARANEICQLHVEDVKTLTRTNEAGEVETVSYIDLSTFDESGNRLDRRRVKTEASERAIPIHSELVDAGFLEFVDRRRVAGEERLFPDLKVNVLGYFSHELSKWFGRWLDGVGMSDPKFCLHSLRHGFKDAGDTVRLPEYILEALGGWGSNGSQARKYGGRCSPERVWENREHIELIRHGDFTLGAAPRGQEG